MAAVGGCGSRPLTHGYAMPPVAADGGRVVLEPGLFDHAAFTPWLSGPIGSSSHPADAGPWQTRARFAWNSQYLFIWVESIGPPPNSPYTHHDDLLHQADVVELFLDVTGERRRIIEIQVNPQNVTADYLHIWNNPPQYPADHIDTDFYRANHRADLAWDINGLITRSLVEPLAEGRARWTVMMAVPIGQALAAEGKAPRLKPGQSVYVNVLRYADIHASAAGGKRTFRQYNLVPVKQGCPHQSPMAVMQLTAKE